MNKNTNRNECAKTCFKRNNIRQMSQGNNKRIDEYQKTKSTRDIDKKKMNLTIE